MTTTRKTWRREDIEALVAAVSDGAIASLARVIYYGNPDEVVRQKLVAVLSGAAWVDS